MSLSNNFPNLSPSLLLDFASAGALDPRITFTRASTGTYYDGVTTAKAEENLLLQSQDFTTSWLNVGAATTANTSTAPDGTITADTLVEDTNTTIHVTAQTVAVSGTVTLSVFAKLGSGTRFLTIGLNRDTTHTASATFDLSLGTNTQTQVNGGIYTSPSATITAVTQSFYRCTFTVTTDTANSIRIGLNNTGTPTTANRAFGANYTGDGTSSLIIWGAQLEQRSAVTAYTATTTQPITNYIPVLQTAAANVARFDHTPTTGEALGLLVEEQRTNLVTYSEQFDNAAWAKTASSITANAIASPDGALTADKLVEDTAASSHGVSAATAPTTTISTNYSISIFAKKAERNFLQIFFTGGHVTGNPRANYDLNTGTLGSVDSGITATITAVGNGWYRCVASVVAATTALRPFFNTVTSSSAARNESYTGDGYSGIFIWGAQLEAGAFPTSYIATTSAQVTRSADVASMTGTNFSSWFNNAEGALFVSGQCVDHPSGFPRYAVLGDGTSSNFIQLYMNASANLLGCEIYNSASFVLSQTIKSSYTGQAVKAVIAYKTNDSTGAADGVVQTTDTSCTVPTVDRLTIGVDSSTGAGFLGGTVSKLAYYPIRVTNAQLQALTS